MDTDYRIEHAGWLRGHSFVRKPWSVSNSNPSRDHDHCSACWARIWDQPESDPDSFAEGFASLAFDHFTDDYHWFCPPCFTDLRETLDLNELKASQ